MLIGIFILLAVLLNVGGYLFNLKYSGVFSDEVEFDNYQVRSQLLTEAMDEVGVCSPEKAAEVWARGLMKRSAALQYAVLGQELKTEYAKQLERKIPNWVTGMSSPWVESFEIIKTEKPNEDTYIFHLQLSTVTSPGPAGTFNAVLTVAREGDFWRIIKISADKELYPYIGFDPGVNGFAVFMILTIIL